MNPSSGPSIGHVPPRLLLVEDDPVSQLFLQEALLALPAQVQVAATGAEALRLAAEAPPALCLIDAHLPDGSGLDLLQALRRHGVRAPAIAHTAESAPTLHDALRAGGFIAVLHKPLTVDALHRAVRDALAGRDGLHAGTASQTADTSTSHADQTAASACTAGGGAERAAQLAALPVWDDAAALRALNGNTAIVDGMRSLFRNELAQTLPRIATLHAAADLDALRGELHTLKAATAFVGAAQLAAAVGLYAQCSALGQADAGAYADVVTAAEAVLRAG